MSKNVVFVGSPDRGKSFACKNFLKKISYRENYIYDINNEYEFKNEFSPFTNMEDFLETIEDVEDSNIVFEEASAFFSSQGSTNKNVINQLCRRFHTRNFNILVFHSLRKIPIDILDYIDIMYIFRTEDLPQNVYKRFGSVPRIIKMYEDVYNKTDRTEFNREKKTYKDDNSKKYFHYHRIYTK